MRAGLDLPGADRLGRARQRRRPAAEGDPPRGAGHRRTRGARLGVAEAATTRRAGAEDAPHHAWRQAVGGAGAAGVGRRRRRTDRAGRRRSAGSPASSASWASRPTKRDAAQAGETVGLGKLDGARTGMTLGDRQDGAARRSSTLAPPEPVLGMAVASAERKDEVKLSVGARRRRSRKTRRSASPMSRTPARRCSKGRARCTSASRSSGSPASTASPVRTHEPHVPYKETIRGSVERPRPAQEAVRRPRPVRRRGARHQAAAARLGLRVRRDDHRRRRAAELHSPRSRRASREYLAQRAARLPGGRRRGDADRRLVPHGRFLRHGLPHGGADRHARGHAAVPAGAARAGAQGRDRRAVRGDAAGQRHRLAAPRPAPRLRRAARLEGLGRGRGDDPAGRDPRPHRRAALGDGRRRHLQGALRPSRRTDRQARRPGDRAGQRPKAA